MQWQTQSGDFTTNMKVKIDLTLPEFITTVIVMWECHVYDSAKGRYDMILGIDILIELLLNIKCFEHAIEAGDGTLKGP